MLVRRRGMKPTPLDVEIERHQVKVLHCVWHADQVSGIVTVVPHSKIIN